MKLKELKRKWEKIKELYPSHAVMKQYIKALEKENRQLKRAIKIVSPMTKKGAEIYSKPIDKEGAEVHISYPDYPNKRVHIYKEGEK